MKPGRVVSLALALALTLASGARASGQTRDPFNQRLLRAFHFRNVGPFRMGARTSDIAVPSRPEKDHLYTFYVSTWTGGVWKTTNGGTTFQPIFDAQDKLTVGAVTLAPSDPDIVWVGTGEAYGSRSSYPGDGVYKSTDAGAIWTHMGLRDTQHISRIVIDPRNADVVYVAAMGHLYTPNQQRGVFKTTDGGRTWSKVFFESDTVGVFDLVMDPKDPDVLYASTYDMLRLPWMYRNGGPGSGIYKTTDGGAHWTKLTNGLPTGRIGKIGLALYPKDPRILYAFVNNVNTRLDSAGRPMTGRGGRPLLVGGEVYRTEDGGAHWAKRNGPDDNLSPKGGGYIGSGDEDLDGFTQIRVDPNDPDRIFTLSVSLGNSTDGGRTWHDINWPPTRLFSKIFGDIRALWIDPENADRMILGSDGGIVLSFDGGRTAAHLTNLPVGEVYGVGVDMEDPYDIYAGLQDHEEWKGPSIGPNGNVTTWDWHAVGSGDGMFTVVDPTDSRWLYTTNEWGGMYRVDQKLGYRKSIRPVPPAGDPPYRFVWGTPFAMSPHDPKTVYTGGQYLLKSTDRGDHWTRISPDLTTHDRRKILASSEGREPGGTQWFAIYSISESPVKAGVIWVGTSDGKVQVTRDDGGHWTDVTANVARAGGPEGALVSRVRASFHAAGTAYVAKNGNKTDDFHPYLYRTTDYGKTWTSVAGDLPDEPINVVWEDRVNPDLLFVGDNAGLFVSIDGGRHWVKMNNEIPDVPVHDLLVHPGANDLVVGSWGRGIWVTNVEPLQEMSERMLAEPVHLFRVQPTEERVTWQFGANDYLFGDRHIVTPNPPDGMVIRYYLRGAAPDSATVVVSDSAGREVARLRGGASEGIHTVIWSMRRAGGRRGRGRRGGGPPASWAPLGTYSVRLDVAGRTLTEPARIAEMQGWSLGPNPRVIQDRH